MRPIRFLLIRLVAGVLSGMFGIGGGVVIVPALVVLTRFSPEAATGTSLDPASRVKPSTAHGC